MRDAAFCCAKHTAFQPTEAQWCCPKCGADPEFFYIDASDASAHDECNQLHDKDSVLCNRCGGGWTGKALAAILAKRLRLVTCPTCKGRGVVDDDDEAT